MGRETNPPQILLGEGFQFATTSIYERGCVLFGSRYELKLSITALITSH
jgi:hypothetical protein